MNLQTIVDKRKYYADMLRTLETKDISEEVESRLQLERKRIEDEVKAEITKDIDKCKNYINILDELITDETTRVADVEPELPEVTTMPIQEDIQITCTSDDVNIQTEIGG